jgi:hypothetical protein
MRFAYVLFLLLVQARPPVAQIDRLGEEVFIGQLYPSGNAYLKPFTGDSASKPLWPENLTLIALGESRSDLPLMRPGALDRVLASTTEDDVVKSIYIPGLEGMDEGHDACGLGRINRQDPEHVSISHDFFRANIDHCEPNDGVAVYRSMPSKYSVMTIGVPAGVAFATQNVILDKRLRPLTAAEKAEIDRQKAAVSGNSNDCTTEPAYRDAAVQMFEGTTRGGNVTLRVSFYSNPGCGGHIADIYILDLLSNGELLKSFEIRQFQGVL